eukprot:2816933-Pleurochrysis_carterae.AAC.1
MSRYMYLAYIIYIHPGPQARDTYPRTQGSARPRSPQPWLLARVTHASKARWPDPAYSIPYA